MGDMAHYPNPAAAAQRLVAEYRGTVLRSLFEAIPEAAEDWRRVLADAVKSSSQALDHVWFTLRRPYVFGSSLYELQTRLSLDQRVVDAFAGKIGRLYRHQERAIEAILSGHDTVIATGTGSGKTEAFLVPVFELCVRSRACGVKAIIVYPRNALVADQYGRLCDYARHAGVTVGRMVGDDGTEETRRERSRCLDSPPEVLVTNHVMLERIQTVGQYEPLRGTGSLQAVVLDEAHTYCGTAAADIAWLLRRVRATSGTRPVAVGASATLGSAGGPIGDTTGGDRGLESFIESVFSSDGRQPVELVLPEHDDTGWNADVAVLPEPINWNELPASDDRTPLNEEKIEQVLGLEGAQKRSKWEFLEAAPTRRSEAWSSRLRQHAVVRRWREQLTEQGALAYEELVGLASEAWQDFHSRSCPDPARLTAACLAAVMYVNWLAGEEQSDRPFDLVTHVVLCEARGTLKRRLWEDSLYLGSERQCPHTGRPMHDVWRDGLQWSLAILDPLSRTLSAEKNHPEQFTQLVVRLANAEDVAAPPDAIRVRLVWEEADDSLLPVVVDEAGSHVMALLPDANEIASMAVEPQLSPHHLDYMEWLSQAMVALEEDLDGGPHLLAFGDGRELVSRVGYVVSEARADGYLLHLASAGSHEPVPLEDALRQVEASLVAEPPTDDYAAALREHVPLWFARLCATPARRYPRHRGLLKLADTALSSLGSPADPAQQLVVEAAIAEGCVAWYAHDWVSEPQFDERPLAEFDFRERTARRLLTTSEGVEPAASNSATAIQSVPLTGHPSSTWREGVERCGGSAAVELACEALFEAGVLLKLEDLLVHDDTQVAGYALDPRHVLLEPRSEQMLEEWRAVGVHSSETDAALRKRYEEDFREGRSLRVIVATPTLELGIDIGKLRHVLCLDLPPNPAAYAQRIGRAGRSSTPGSMYALGVVWCRDDNPREMFFYNDPDELRQMLAGQVAPPPVEVNNPLVARRHLYACALQDRLRKDPHWVSAAAQELVSWRPPEALEGLLAGVLDWRVEIEETLLAALQQRLEDGPVAADASDWFYASTLSPDYGFRRDAVTLKDGALASAHSGADDALSQRPPEQAVQTWAIDRVVALPAGHYRLVEGCGEKTFELDGREIPQWREFRCEREEGLAGRYGRPPRYDVTAQLDGKADMRPVWSAGEWLRCYAASDTLLTLVNRGPLFGDRKDIWGHHGPCAGVVFAYDACILSKEQQASLVCVLDHAIQRFFRLGEGELVLLHPLQPPALELRWLEDRPSEFVALLDVAARGVLPLDAIGPNLTELLTAARNRMDGCTCQDGCYRCLRTYGTGRLVPFASRTQAKQLLDSIIDGQPLVVSVPQRPMVFRSTEEAARVEIRQAGQSLRIDVDGARWGQVPAEDGKKPAVFGAVRQAIAAVAPRGMHLATNLSWLGDLLRGHRCPNDAEDRRLLFESLRLASFELEE